MKGMDAQSRMLTNILESFLVPVRRSCRRKITVNTGHLIPARHGLVRYIFLVHLLIQIVFFFGVGEVGYYFCYG